MSSDKISRLFWGATAFAVVFALAIFTANVGNGRITGPGVLLALAVGVLALIGRLLVEAARALVQTGEGAEEREQKAAVGRRRKELEREYYNLKRALKELELDHAMGKVSEDDYAEIRTRYRERAVRILRQLDQGESYRSQIEQDLRARRQARGLSPRPEARADAKADAKADTKADTKAESEAGPTSAAPPDAATPAAASTPPACPSCGTANDGDALFCKKCGTRLAGSEASSR